MPEGIDGEIDELTNLYKKYIEESFSEQAFIQIQGDINASNTASKDQLKLAIKKHLDSSLSRMKYFLEQLNPGQVLNNKEFEKYFRNDFIDLNDKQTADLAKEAHQKLIVSILHENKEAFMASYFIEVNKQYKEFCKKIDNMKEFSVTKDRVDKVALKFSRLLLACAAACTFLTYHTTRLNYSYTKSKYSIPSMFIPGSPEIYKGLETLAFYSPALALFSCAGALALSIAAMVYGIEGLSKKDTIITEATKKELDAMFKDIMHNLTEKISPLANAAAIKLKKPAAVIEYSTTKEPAAQLTTYEQRPQTVKDPISIGKKPEDTKNAGVDQLKKDSTVVESSKTKEQVAVVESRAINKPTALVIYKEGTPPLATPKTPNLGADNQTKAR